jgi:hypothetical protein
LVVFAAWHKEVGRSAGFFGELEKTLFQRGRGTYAIWEINMADTPLIACLATLTHRGNGQFPAIATFSHSD